MQCRGVVRSSIERQKHIEYEQPLINRFVNALYATEDDELRVRDLHNKNCRSPRLADLEFTSHSGLRWAIEAKYGAPSNKHNEVHKLFGDLLRETGRPNRSGCRIGLLLHARMEAHFREGICRINRRKFIEFGLLVPVDSVFVCDELGSFERRTWAQFYDGPGGVRQAAPPPSR